MGIKTKLEAELKSALKNKDTRRLSAIREILGAVKYAELNKEGGSAAELSGQEEVQILSKLKKRHLESIEAFEKGNRPELVSKERAELKVVEEYLPAMMTAQEIEQMVKEAVAEVGAQSLKDMGKVMANLKDKYTGRADGKAVSEEVKRRLTELAGA
jgi:uncharacterized protein